MCMGITMCTIIFSLSPKYILFQLSTNIFPVGPTYRYIIRLDNNAYNYTEARRGHLVPPHA